MLEISGSDLRCCCMNSKIKMPQMCRKSQLPRNLRISHLDLQQQTVAVQTKVKLVETLLRAVHAVPVPGLGPTMWGALGSRWKGLERPQRPPALVVLMGRESFTDPVPGEEAAGRGVHGFWVGTFSQIFHCCMLGQNVGWRYSECYEEQKYRHMLSHSIVVELHSIRVVMVVWVLVLIMCSVPAHLEKTKQWSDSGWFVEPLVSEWLKIEVGILTIQQRITWTKATNYRQLLRLLKLSRAGFDPIFEGSLEVKQYGQMDKQRWGESRIEEKKREGQRRERVRKKKMQAKG